MKWEVKYEVKYEVRSEKCVAHTQTFIGVATPQHFRVLCVLCARLTKYEV